MPETDAKYIAQEVVCQVQVELSSNNCNEVLESGSDSAPIVLPKGTESTNPGKSLACKENKDIFSDSVYVPSSLFSVSVLALNAMAWFYIPFLCNLMRNAFIECGPEQ